MTEVELRRKVANPEVGELASATVLQAALAARNVYVATGSYELVEPDAAGRVTQVPRDYLAPDALTAGYRSR